MWWLFTAALASGLDLPEVGGLWGTPAETGPTAVWFNPGALALGHGTRVLVDVAAPLHATLRFDRSGPFGGPSAYNYTGVVPFVGVATDAGVRGLGLGLSFFVPYAVAGGPADPDAPLPSGRTHLRQGSVFPFHVSLAASYAWKDVLSFGAAVTVIHSRWGAQLDFSTVPDLADTLADLGFGGDEPTDFYSDEDLEDPDYLLGVDFGPLPATTASLQAGIAARPHPDVLLSVGFALGTPRPLVHRGGVAIDAGCPPEDDLFGRAGAQLYGLCDADIAADATIAYRYPMRVHVGAAWQVKPELRLELMGGWTGWSAYDDLRITVTDPVSANTELGEPALDALTLDRRWGRGARDTFWVGVDAKGDVGPLVLGGQARFDRAAIPNAWMGPNNFDFDAATLGALLGVRPTRKADLVLALSYQGRIAAPRTVTDSAFGLAVDPAARNPDRAFYPQMNGRYTSGLHRLALSVRWAIDARRVQKPAPAPDDVPGEQAPPAPLEDGGVSGPDAPQ